MMFDRLLDWLAFRLCDLAAWWDWRGMTIRGPWLDTKFGDWIGWDRHGEPVLFDGWRLGEYV